ncbi:MAG: 23S rRNA (adenine(2503)-C(2))-methyltransferase RlmN [Acidimicrobiales bacterium]|nr:23S rRNA (adenine(2503)-C(2))-methyltransferase RlmN [Acidimicrobiales bacterium]
MSQTITRYDHDRESLAELLHEHPAYRVDQLWRGLYDDGLDVEAISTLPKGLRGDLATLLPAALENRVERISEGGETHKWLWGLPDGDAVETVLMHYTGRSTVCVSSQAGCAMACGFCATGQEGFRRHLTTGEIVEQVIRAREAAKPRRLSNVVFMGMGEPLANYDATWGAVRRIHADLGLSARHITMSTVGLIPGIRRMATEDLPISLAVSLHAATDELRNELVPINKRYPISDLADACQEYVDASGRRLSFEWALIDGVNDTEDQAKALASLCKRLRAHVNLIPLNPTPGYPTIGTSSDGVKQFQRWLLDRNTNATIRRNRGTDIDAACGQLRATQSSGEQSVAAPRRR